MDVISQKIDESLKRRARNIVSEIQDNTEVGFEGITEFAKYAGYTGGGSLLYGIFKSVVRDVLYQESLEKKPFKMTTALNAVKKKKS